MEIARTVGERLIDLKASIEMSQRLMSLQRQRIAANQVMDQQARRVVHDEVLPQLHAAMLALSDDHSEDASGQEGIQMLTEVHRRLSDLLREMPATSAPQLARLGLLPALEEIVQQEFRASFNQVNVEITDEARKRTFELPAMMAEVLYYAAREAVRNAAQHAGSESIHGDQPVDLSVVADWHKGVLITVQDNGCGIDHDVSQSTEDGHGLALHSTLMAVVGGSLSVESIPGSFTRVVLHLPLPQDLPSAG
jgi:signal transduction histidine kinase